jgi:hypothetical protein
MGSLFLFLFSFSLSTLLTLPSPPYPYSHPLHFPSLSCAKFHCSTSQLFFLSLLIHSFPLPAPSPTIPPQPVTTHHLLTNLLYKLHTTPIPWNLWHKHPTLQQQKYIQTHTRATKPSRLHTASPTHPPNFPSSLLVPPYPIVQISIASLINDNPPNPTAHRYYHQGFFYIIYKQLVRY